MKKTTKVKDGWHTVYGWEVWVENGKCKRVRTQSGARYFYKTLPRTYGGGQIRVEPSLSALRTGLKSRKIHIQ